MVEHYRTGAVSAAQPDPVLAADFAELRERVEQRIDAAELTLALEEIWQRVRRLNRYVEERAPWRLAREKDQAAELDVVLATLIEGLRTLGVLLWPYIPASAERLLGALGVEDVSLASAQLGAGVVSRVAPIEALFPKEQAAAGPA